MGSGAAEEVTVNMAAATRTRIALQAQATARMSRNALPIRSFFVEILNAGFEG